MSESIIEIKNLNLTYENDEISYTALKDINLSIKKYSISLIKRNNLII